jgi:hypothetical protein
MNALGETARPRLVPDLPLPPYSYVPGRFPHPVSDPAGHRFGKPVEKPPPLDPDYWEESRAYLYGIDLFNHGYYWEAHEAWEGLWHACGRLGPAADFLKGLIKLAAAGVKVREGKPHGVVSHSARAQELFWQIDQRLGGRDARFLGLGLGELIDFTDAVGRRALSASGDADTGVKVVFDFVLRPVLGGEGR